MSYQKMQSNYLANEVMQASPKRLIELLLEGCIKNLKLAVIAIDKEDVNLAHNKLVRAQDIISELRYSINEEVGGEVAQQFIQLYEYINNQLVLANLKKDKAVVEKIEGMVEELLATWKQLEV
ncbi:flagellar export chaperone FliS [Enterococcus cecorum]|uniref:Flagellar protein FliS n=1 Tax=Enterococcus cecorum TaxID=44008 RepID=A0A366SIW4_9ENTE|nr:flagellar export chaperone FliS [Enterococcus cecorum]RBR31786.1 flagellar protein FliS [Enterococcus cecorum]